MTLQLQTEKHADFKYKIHFSNMVQKNLEQNRFSEIGSELWSSGQPGILHKPHYPQTNRLPSNSTSRVLEISFIFFSL